MDATFCANHSAGVDRYEPCLVLQMQGPVDRAITVDYDGMSIPVCTAEDLVVHKAIADRPKDWIDIEGVVQRQGERLDVPYVRKWLREWGEALEKDLLGRFESILAK